VYLTYSLIVQSTLIHLNRNCSGLPVSAFLAVAALIRRSLRIRAAAQSDEGGESSPRILARGDRSCSPTASAWIT